LGLIVYNFITSLYDITYPLVDIINPLYFAGYWFMDSNNTFVSVLLKNGTYLLYNTSSTEIQDTYNIGSNADFLATID